MRHQGRITQWNDERGFGFVAPDGGGERVFLHIKAFERKHRRPNGDDYVTYALCRDERNRPRAADVRYAGASAVPAGTLPTALIVVVFLAFVAMIARGGRVPWWILLVYAGISIVTFFVYRADKEKAGRHEWRTPESTLHLLALMGGWPGALMAQQALQHKNRKLAFLVPFWGIVIAHFALWAYVLTSPSP